LGNGNGFAEPQSDLEAMYPNRDQGEAQQDRQRDQVTSLGGNQKMNDILTQTHNARHAPANFFAYFEEDTKESCMAIMKQHDVELIDSGERAHKYQITSHKFYGVQLALKEAGFECLTEYQGYLQSCSKEELIEILAEDKEQVVRHEGRFSR